MHKLAGFNHNQTAIRSMQEIEAGTEETLRQAAQQKKNAKHSSIRIMKDLHASNEAMKTDVKHLASDAKGSAEAAFDKVKQVAKDFGSTAQAAAQRSAESIKQAADDVKNNHFNDNPRNQPEVENVDDKEKLQRNTAAALWIATFLFSILPGLLVLLVKSDNQYLREQAQEAINWSITMVFGTVICSLLMLIFIGYPLMLLLGVAHVVFCFLGFQAALSGSRFRVPLSWRPLWG